MDTLYFVGFCVFIFVIVAWGYKFDDYEEFNDELGNKKFTIKRKAKMEQVEEREDASETSDDDDLPRGNLL